MDIIVSVEKHKVAIARGKDDSMKINKHQLEVHMNLQGVTGADLSRLTGLNQSTISNTRSRGSCDYVTLVKLADALKIDREVLLPLELQEG